jgi:hypothetical protein
VRHDGREGDADARVALEDVLVDDRIQRARAVLARLDLRLQYLQLQRKHRVRRVAQRRLHRCRLLLERLLLCLALRARRAASSKVKVVKNVLDAPHMPLPKRNKLRVRPAMVGARCLDAPHLVRPESDGLHSVAI